MRLPGNLVPYFSCRTKYTAPASVKEVVGKKLHLKSQPHPTVANVDLAKHTMTHMKNKNKQKLDIDHNEDMFAFQNISSFDAQIESLKTKGFLRAYQPYQPPADLLPRFLSICSTTLGISVDENELESISLKNIEDKVKVLKSLQSEFGHAVYNSRLHEMKNLKQVFLFYSCEVCVMTPYDKLDQDSKANLLPPNLVVQLDPIRFTGKGDHHLDKVTAWPRTHNMVTGLRAREKYPSMKAEYSPWEEHDYSQGPVEV